MQKRAFSRSIKAISGFQIILLISMTFAFSFLLSQEFQVVSAAVPDVGSTVNINIGGNLQAVKVTQQFTSNNGFNYVTSDGVAGFAETGSIVTGPLSGAAAGVAKLTAPAITNTPTITSITKLQTSFDGTKTFGLKGSFQGADLNVAQVVDPAAAGITGPANANYFVGENGNLYTGTAGVGGSLTLVKEGYSYKAFGLIEGNNFFMGNFLQGLGAAVGVGGLVLTLASMFGASSKQSTAYAAAVASGILGYKTAIGLFGKNIGKVGGQGIWGNSLSTKWAGAIGLAVGVAVLLIMYKDETQKTITFQCLPWEPQLGGSKCEQCNNDPYKPCSEYRCKSLGQACELLNKGSDKAQCAWVSKGDVQSPTIQEWTQALRPTNLQYTPANAIRPGARGVTIVSPDTEDGCLPAFAALEFGILTNEPAQCKIDYNRSVNFDGMQYYFGESNFYEYNHTQRMRLPSSNDLNGASPVLQNDGTFGLSVRCRDANGNVNEDEYTINFCVSAGPDTTPPIVESTSIDSESPVRFGADSIPMEVYTNEPATCKWSKQDKDYTEMENTLVCATDASQINADLQYTCAGNFTGVANDETEKFFIRCADQPTAPESERNTMTESYIVNLRGTIELTLLSAGPNSTTISASTSAIPVELFAQTDDGADQGKAVCYFSPSGTAGSYLEFFESGDISHKQSLDLSSGNYTYYIRCIDAGGNNAETTINFNVALDNSAPEVTRVYKRGDDALQIITNEPAQCVYSKTSCNYEIEDGLEMTYPSIEQQRVHLTLWKAKSAFYIKCKDAYGNQPSPNSCSIVVSGSDISAKAIVV